MKNIIRILERFLLNLKDFPKNLKYYFKNIIKWSPILWKDRDWDHYFIYEALRFKIQKTSECINLNQRYIGFERDVEIMNTCVRLISKIQENYYELEYQDYQKTNMYTTPEENGCSRLHVDILEDHIEDYYKKYKNDVKRFKGKLSGLRLGYYRQERAKTILFRLIENNIDKWWD